MNHQLKQHTLKKGIAAAWPICLGYVPIGLALGVLGQKAGLSPVEMGIMSILVFAGSAQFIGVSMLAAGASLPAIVTTTFVVNLRHILMSSSLAKHLNEMSIGGLSLFAYGVTDESFAVNHTLFSTGNWDPAKALVVNHTANFVWILSTIFGGFFGELIPAGAFGIDYALIAMFIGLLVFQLKNSMQVLAGLAAGITATVMAFFVEGNMHVIVGAIAGASIAYALFVRAQKNNLESQQKGKLD